MSCLDGPSRRLQRQTRFLDGPSRRAVETARVAAAILTAVRSGAEKRWPSRLAIKTARVSHP